jgi:hypothetical protein
MGKWVFKQELFTGPSMELVTTVIKSERMLLNDGRFSQCMSRPAAYGLSKSTQAPLFHTSILVIG